MTAPWIIIQCFYQSGLDRISMNIPHQLKQVWICFNEQSLKSSSEQWPIMAVFPVESLGIDPIDVAQASR
jgi:hypothetical protein